MIFKLINQIKCLKKGISIIQLKLINLATKIKLIITFEINYYYQIFNHINGICGVV